MRFSFGQSVASDVFSVVTGVATPFAVVYAGRCM
jgi:hypothetical protein